MKLSQAHGRRRKTILAGLALVALAAVTAAAQEEGLRPRPRTLSVSGEGLYRTRPDLARVNVGVVTEGPTARVASEENARKMTRVMEALRSAGIAAEKVRTVQIAIEPVYDYQQPNGPPRLRGFRARNVVEATTDDLERLGEVLDAVIAVGGNTVEGIQFELADLGAAQAEALRVAVADARRKAEALAAAAGLRLGEIHEINATYGGPPIPWIGAQAALMEARVDAAPPPVSPGELTVSANVQVVYRLE